MERRVRHYLCVLGEKIATELSKQMTKQVQHDVSEIFGLAKESYLEEADVVQKGYIVFLLARGGHKKSDKVGDGASELGQSA